MEEFKILYDLVKETRDDVKSLNDRLNAHVLATSTKITEVKIEAKAPVTFLKTAKESALWIGAMGGVYALLTSFFSHHKS